MIGLMLCTATFSHGQTSQSRDKELDANLKTITLEANKDLAGFKLQLSKTYSVTPVKINSMFSIGMSAGDVFISLEIATIAKKPVDDVIAVYSKSKSKGWGVMAKELGIKPGSAEFHQLKSNCGKQSGKKAKTGGNGNGNSHGNGHSNGNGKKK